MEDKVIEKVRTLRKGFVTVNLIKVLIKDTERLYEQIEIKGAVAGLVITEDAKIGLVHQFRAAAEKVVIEILAGTLDKSDANHWDILFEELEEEMGIDTSENNEKHHVRIHPYPILEYFMMIGVCTGKMTIYSIRVKPQEDRKVEDSDVRCTEWVDIDTFGRYIEEGKIVDGKSIMAYWYLRSHPELLQKQKSDF